MLGSASLHFRPPSKMLFFNDEFRALHGEFRVRAAAIDHHTSQTRPTLQKVNFFWGVSSEKPKVHFFLFLFSAFPTSSLSRSSPQKTPSLSTTLNLPRTTSRAFGCRFVCSEPTTRVQPPVPTQDRRYNSERFLEICSLQQQFFSNDANAF